jgi:hypothetical protein
MKIAYFVQISLHENDGVINKIKNQLEAWLSFNHDVQLIMITSSKEVQLQSTVLHKLNQEGRVNFFRTKTLGLLPTDVLRDWLGLESTFSKARICLNEFNPDVVYARYSLFQPFYRKIGESFRLIIEVNTDFESEYFLLRKESLKRYLRYLYYKSTNALLLRSVSGVVTVTKELRENYTSRPVAVIPNSLKVSDYNAPVYKSDPKKISLIFLGTPGMSWQGIDILVKLAAILKNIKFHVIGYSSADFKNVPDNVVLHGFLKKDEYLELMVNSTAAIGTLALSRKKMEEACPLKVREYMACCRPLILPYKETVFEMKEYPDWTLRVDIEKDGISNSAKKISTFLERCSKFSITQADVLQYIDVSEIEKLRLHFFETILKNKG